MTGKIIIATDAWSPQVNGVVTTYRQMEKHLDNCLFVTPHLFRNFPMPGYNEIKLSLVTPSMIDNIFSQYDIEHIHIATEGPIGLAVRRWCIKNNKKFTTSYHTKFPEFVQAMYKIPAWLVYSYFRYFHNKSSAVMVATESLDRELKARGFKNTVMWSKGVDTDQFRPTLTEQDKVKTLLYVGRVSKEKNIEAFLKCQIPNSRKIVVGSGPDLQNLINKYKDSATFVGSKTGEDLTYYYNLADVFVFPSKSDTFGLVILEALACGTPVAAYPVTGPIDILNPKIGAMSEDLEQAINQALTLDRYDCYKFTEQYSWKKVAEHFLQIIKSVS